GARLAIELLDLDDVPDSHLVLLAAGLDDRVHESEVSCCSVSLFHQVAADAHPQPRGPGTPTTPLVQRLGGFLSRQPSLAGGRRLNRRLTSPPVRRREFPTHHTDRFGIPDRPGRQEGWSGVTAGPARAERARSAGTRRAYGAATTRSIYRAEFLPEITQLRPPIRT